MNDLATLWHVYLLSALFAAIGWLVIIYSDGELTVTRLFSVIATAILPVINTLTVLIMVVGAILKGAMEPSSSRAIWRRK